MKIIDCKKVENERGSLQEVLRNDDKHFTQFGQVYFTNTLCGISKAWYKHDFQTDNIFVVKGTMKIGLKDDRIDSKTYGQENIFTIDDANPQLIQIPPGVWHGFKACDVDLLLMHLNSEPIDLKNKDEKTLGLINDVVQIEL